MRFFVTSYQGNAPVANNLYGVANGTNSNVGYITVFMTRDPTHNDINYQVKQRWLNTSTATEWILLGFTSSAGVTLANWLQLSDGTLTPTSWTPTVFGGTDAGTFTPIPGGATGTYSQIGRLVFTQFATLGTVAGASGDLVIGNFPITINATLGNSFGACVIESTLTWPTTTNVTTSLAAFGNVGTKTCSIYCSVSGGGGGNLQIADVIINIQGSLVYFS